MNAAIELLRVDPSKLESIQEKLWCDVETPIVAVAAECQIDRSSFSGIVVITRGAVYVFKSKIFGSVDLCHRICYMKISSIDLGTGSVRVGTNHGQVVFKCDEAPAIARAIITIVKEGMFGLPESCYKGLRESGPVAPVEVTERPESLMKWRALILGHTCTEKEKYLTAVDYFNKWEAKQGQLLLIGPSFRPGNYAEVFGKAVAWESMVDSVCFQRVLITKFGSLMHSILEESINIRRIAMTEYKNPVAADFAMTQVKRTKVNSWWFMRCCAAHISGWITFTDLLPAKSVEDLVMVESEMNGPLLSELGRGLEHSRGLSGLRSLELGKIDWDKMPAGSLTTLMNSCQSLERVNFRYVLGDASDLLKQVCLSKAPLRVIDFGGMSFKTPIYDCHLPSNLLCLAVSGCAFSPRSLACVFTLLVHGQRALPIVFQAIQIQVKGEFYAILSELDLGTAQPNISEFDWSGNPIPVSMCRPLFAFLFTQKRLYLLSLNGIGVDDPTGFMTLVMQLAQALPLYGLEFASNIYNPTLFAQFIQALATVPTLRHLVLTKCEAGDQGLAALTELVQRLPNLNELGADGFGPQSPGAICSFWSTLSRCEELKICDLPSDDMRNIGMQPQKLDAGTQRAFAALKARPRLVPAEQRLDCQLAAAREGRQPNCSPTIFIEAAAMPWKKPYIPNFG